MLSFLADSTKPHVLTTTVSASSGSSTSRKPLAASRPASSSESTSLRAQPRVTRATDVRSSVSSWEGSVVVMIESSMPGSGLRTPFPGQPTTYVPVASWPVSPTAPRSEPSTTTSTEPSDVATWTGGETSSALVCP